MNKSVLDPSQKNLALILWPIIPSLVVRSEFISTVGVINNISWSNSSDVGYCKNLWYFQYLHNLKLQGRPYRKDDVNGELTVQVIANVYSLQTSS